MKKADNPVVIVNGNNSDVEVTPGWLDAPIAALEKEADIAAVQPKIRAWRNKNYFEYAGAAGGFMDRYGYPYCRGRVFDVVEKDEGQYDAPAEKVFTDVLFMLAVAEVFRMFLNSQASEQGARMTSMDNATRNATDMISRLTLKYNRIRQTAITTELTEIISGSEAL